MSLSKLTLTTCLWFDGQAEDAANFYVSIFKNSKVTHVQRYTDAGKEHHGQEAGTVLVAEFDLDGHRFVGLNGGPHYKLTPATSVMIDWWVFSSFSTRRLFHQPTPMLSFMLSLHALTHAPSLPRAPLFQSKTLTPRPPPSQNQEEVDYYWDKLSEGSPEASQQCGWVTDKFGLSWQVVPKALKEMLSSPDKEGAGRATVAMMQMKKLDIAGLQKAFDG